LFVWKKKVFTDGFVFLLEFRLGKGGGLF